MVSHGALQVLVHNNEKSKTLQQRLTITSFNHRFLHLKKGL